ncbi:MAG TPA: hypothetical protein DEP42_06660, partial [Ruminococcaceae bacterium]|nr:hypothetical protein [Oscillospiraceae bacterium]
MLRLILGRAGSGKTHLALDTAIKIASSGKDVVFVVPEQFTFETERTLLESLGPSMCLHAEVLSFSRMATRVFELYGGRSGRAIDDCGRLLLMNRAVKQVRDMLKVYRSQAESIAFSKKMVDTLSEFKYRGISAADLLDVGRRAKDEALNFKLMDLSLLLQTYDAMSSTLFMDSLDDLTRLSEKLEKHLFFQNKIVIIDAFKGFTSPQKEVIAHILQQSQDVYIALCVDGVRQNADEMGLFSPVRKTARELIQMANHLGQQVASPILLKEQYRFSSSDLAALEKNIFRVKHVCTEEIKNIHLISAENVYEESQFVAQEISRLVQKENARYKDIVVISRGLSLYNGILDPICKKYGIPLFLDAQRDLTSHPLMAFFLDALDAITTDFRQEVVLRMLKTGLAGITSVEIAELENYLYTWNYQGIEAWNNEWTEHPDGIGKEKSERSQRHLKGLNRLRERVLMPLKQLSCALETAESGSQKVLALYNFLLSMRAEEQMTQMCT